MNIQISESLINSRNPITVASSRESVEMHLRRDPSLLRAPRMILRVSLNPKQTPPLIKKKPKQRENQRMTSKRRQRKRAKVNLIRQTH